jgi:hypothetical protein
MRSVWVLLLFGWSVVAATLSGPIQSLVAYRRDAAYSELTDKTKGTLEPGKLADRIVLSRVLFHVEPLEIYGAKTVLTLGGAKVVYREGI